MTQTTFVQKGVKVRLELACQIHAKTEMSHADFHPKITPVWEGVNRKMHAMF